MPLVIYAILTEQNIAKLFAAAMVPGVQEHAGVRWAARVTVAGQLRGGVLVVP